MIINLLLSTAILTSLDENNEANINSSHFKTAQRYEVSEFQNKEEADLIEPFAKLRTTFISRDSQNPNQSSYATAIGGNFGFNTSSYKGFDLHASAYVSAKVKPLTGDGNHENQEFFNAKGNSYIYLGEASLNFLSESFNLKLGRLLVDTPFANSDDNRMSPNTFEGAWGNLKFNSKLSSQMYYLSSMAGSGSQGSQNEFDDLYGDKGFGAVGTSIDYHYTNDEHASLWYYYVQNLSHILYAEMNFTYKFDEIVELEGAIQASSLIQDDNSGVDGEVLGIQLLGHYGSFFIAGAYNYGFIDEGNILSDGFGGGPFYTSLDNASIASASEFAVGQDIQVYRIGFGHDKVIFDNLAIEYLHGNFLSQDKTLDILEDDIIMTYTYADKIYFDLVGAKFINKLNKEKTQRLVLRFDYSF